MTRDKAIEVELNARLKSYHAGLTERELAALRIDALVALGVLKLEEPKSVEERTADALAGQKIASTKIQHFGAALGMSDVAMIEGALHKAGLKIVDARSQREG